MGLLQYLKQLTGAWQKMLKTMSFGWESSSWTKQTERTWPQQRIWGTQTQQRNWQRGGESWKEFSSWGYFLLCELIRRLKEDLENCNRQGRLTMAQRKQSLKNCRKEMLFYDPTMATKKGEGRRRITNRTDMEKYIRTWIRSGHVCTFEHLKFRS